MVLGPDGALYGANTGGGYQSNGTLYRLTLDGSFSTIHTFNSDDGSYPLKLVPARGTFYGITEFGGPGTSIYSSANSYGTIFSIGPDGSFNSLYAFNTGTVGTYPNSLILGADGSFYGTAMESSQSNEFGAIFKMTPDGTVTALYTFTGDGQGQLPAVGAYPGGLVQGADGSFYGITGYGANGYIGGSVFKYSASQGLSTLHNFDASVDGTALPNALLPASDGSLYGTTSGTVNDQVPGLGYDNGTVFRIAPDGSISYLYRFSGASDGSTPTFDGLILGSDGRLYGATTAGGANGNGVLYSIGTDGSSFTILHSFNSTDGNYPNSPLLQLDSSTFVGTTRSGGASNNGAAYELAPSPLAPLVRLVASAASAGQGQSVTLTWSSSGTASCTASGQWSGSLATSGSQAVVVSSAGANVFGIACTGNDGSTVSKSITVTGTVPPTASLSASATAVAVGQSVTLNWSSSNATGCTASGAWSGSLATSGSQAVVVSSAGANVFGIACTGSDGSTVSKSITVTGTVPPTASLSASAAVVAVGQSVDLIWSSSNAASCTVSGPTFGAAGNSGALSVVINKAGANVFIMECTGTDGSTISKSLTVTGVVPPTASLSTNVTAAVVGQWATLNWSSANAESCAASGAWSGPLATSGAKVVQISTAGTNEFDLVCGTSGINATAAATVTAYAPRLSLSPGGASPYTLTQQCVTALLQDDATGAPIAGIPVYLVDNGVNPGSQTLYTDGSGTVRRCWTSNAAGTDTLVARSGNAMVSAVIDWLKRPVTMRTQGFINISTSIGGSTAVMKFTAQLSDGLSGAPVAGRTVLFTAKGQDACQAATDASGTATCSTWAGTLNALLYGGYQAGFAGDSAYLPVSADGTLVSVGR
jgi:uncharacterized repeat protein (TIGR03803 family)